MKNCLRGNVFCAVSSFTPCPRLPGNLRMSIVFVKFAALFTDSKRNGQIPAYIIYGHTLYAVFLQHV